jgi:hypothetical protein
MPKKTLAVALVFVLALPFLDGCTSSYRFGIDQVTSFAQTGQAETTRGKRIALDELDALGPVVRDGQDVSGEAMDGRAEHAEWGPVAPDDTRSLRVPDPERVTVSGTLVEIQGPRRSTRFDGRRVHYLVGSSDEPGLTGLAITGGVLGGAVVIGLVVAAAVWTSSGGVCFGGC